MPVAYVPKGLPLGTFLLHCRPRITFHLGHVKMLNVLYELLSLGHKVTVQIVPYEEHEVRNRTLRVRLAEESEITKGFYRSYLGFDTPQLSIVSTHEQEISHERLTQIQRSYVRLYEEGNAAIKRLVDEHNRPWASPNILFVPKCIASIESLKPDYLLCGEKHVIIADGFDALLRDFGHIIESYKFLDFKDLLFETSMDRLDSVHSYIDINDNEDFVLHKLSMLRSQPGLRSKWLSHFVEHIFVPAPERLKDGLSRTLRSEAEMEIALARFLANVRALIPYSLDNGAEIRVAWSNSLFPSFIRAQQQQITRIARQSFREGDTTQITIQRLLGGGNSGSTVLEVREHEGDDARISNVSILKIGPEAEMRQEKHNYDRFVMPRKTAAFMAIKLGGATVDGTTGIVYQDAQHYLGMSVKDRVDTIGVLFKHAQFDPDSAGAAIEQLLSYHMHEVLYKHGARVEAGNVGRQLNEFLPADYRVEVDSYDRVMGRLSGSIVSPVTTLLRGEVDIVGVSLRERVARAYTADTCKKVDLILGGNDEVLLNAIRPGRRMSVEGRIVSTRRDFYDMLYSRLGIAREIDTVSIAPGLQIPDPVAKIDDVLSAEHYDYVVSTVHGDLHAGNVLHGRGNIGIIDYGKMRESFPALYDAAYLLSDVKSRYLSNHFDLGMVARLEERLLRRSISWPLSRHRSIFDRLLVFEYSSLPKDIKELGPESLFYSMTALILLGRLKFGLPEHEKRIGLLLAHYAYLKTL